MLRKIFSALACCLLLGSAGNGSSESQELKNPVRGVQVHLDDYFPAALDLAKNAGFNYVRTGFYWYETETDAQTYTWTRYDHLVSELDARDLRPIFTMYGGNDLYGSREAPRTHEQIDAFSRWAAAAVDRYKGRGIIWEIWNEPNIPRFWKPKPNPSEYAAFANAVCRRIRANNPQEAVFVGALSSTTDIEKMYRYAGYLSTHLDNGCFSGLTVHPYRLSDPESVSETYSQLKGIKGLRSFASGEWGYTTSGPAAISQDLQAKFAVRSFLINEKEGVDFSVWYTLRDQNKPANDGERGYGLVQRDLSAKLSYSAFRTLNDQIKGKRFSSICGDPPAGVESLIYTGSGGDRVLVTWRNIGGYTMRVDIRSVESTGKDLLGKEITLEQNSGEYVLRGSDAPVYLRITPGETPSCRF